MKTLFDLTRSFGTAVLFTVLVLAGCSGGGGGGTAVGGLSSDCEPASAPVGASVVCLVKDENITEDCTLFVGNKPVEFNLNAEDGAVGFKVPPVIPNIYDIHFQCGDSGIKPVGKMEVVAGAGGAATDEEAVTPGEIGDFAEGETITPSGSEGTTTEEPPPPDSDGDGVADATDACPGTPSGTTVDSTGCEPPPEGASGTLTVKKAQDDGVSDARLNTIKIGFTVTGDPKEVYLSGNVFNRTSGDAALAESLRCKKVGSSGNERWLATQPNGAKFNEGSPLYDQNLPYLEGTFCGDDCKKSSASPTAWLDDSGPKRGSRFNDPLLRKDLYGKKLSPAEKNTVMEYKNLSQMQLYPLTPKEDNPWCKIVPKKEDGSWILNGSFSTQSLIQYGKVCLTVVGQDDVSSTTCKTWNAPEATLSVSNAQLTTKAGDNRPKVRVSLSYANAVAVPSVATAAGCSPAAGTSWPAYQGPIGSLEALCDVSTSDLKTTINAAAHGIGDYNSDTHKVTLTLGSPTLEFNFNNGKYIENCEQSGVSSEDCSGNVEFLWKVKRNYDIKDETNASLASGNTHWAKKIRFYEGVSEANAPLKKTVTIGPDDDHGIETFHRDHGHYYWMAIGEDFDGSKFGNVPRPWPYDARFVQGFPQFSWSWHYDCTIDTCGWGEINGCCGDDSGEDPSHCGGCPSADVSECRNHKIHAEMYWQAYHIKKLEMNCGGSFDKQPVASEYKQQGGSWTLDVGGTSKSCTLTVTTYNDGTLTYGPWDMSFSDNC